MARPVNPIKGRLPKAYPLALIVLAFCQFAFVLRASSLIHILHGYGQANSNDKNNFNDIEIEQDAPDHVFFDLSDSSDLLEKFLTSYFESQKSSERARVNDFVKFCHRDNEECRSVAQHPKLLEAMRRLLHLKDRSPLFLWGLVVINAQSGTSHRWHTDGEFIPKECRGLTGGTAWILLNRQCQGRSPVRFLSGSHKLNTTFYDELARRSCWGQVVADDESYDCADNDEIIRDAQEQYADTLPELKLMDGPEEAFMGAAWPSTTWHMTADPCDRKAIVIQYTSSLKCAQKLRARRASGTTPGQFNVSKDLLPYLIVDDTKSHDLSRTFTADDYQEHPFDKVFLPLPTRKALSSIPHLNNGRGSKLLLPCKTLQDPPALPPVESFRKIQNKIFVSDMGRGRGQATSKHHEERLRTSNHAVSVTRQLLSPSSTRFRLAEDVPRVAMTDRVCFVLSGEVAYAVSSKRDCSQTFDAESLSEGDAVYIPMGVPHMFAPGPDSNGGEHICFEYFPYLARTNDNKRTSELPSPAVVKASRIASMGNFLDLDFVMNAKGPRSIQYFSFLNGTDLKSGDAVGTPGYSKLNAKLVHCPAGFFMEPHQDPYDLHLVVVEGSFRLSSGDGGRDVIMSENQVAFVPAGVTHQVEVLSEHLVFFAYEVQAKNSPDDIV